MASITTGSGTLGVTAAAGEHAAGQGSDTQTLLTQIPARHKIILCACLAALWAVCNASVWAISTLAAGTWPAASLALGWPLGVCVGIVVWLSGGGFWRLIIAVGWCIVFPIATPHYFDLCAKLGLFLGRVPNLQTATLTHAMVFFMLPTAVTVTVIAWAARWRNSRASAVLALTGAAATALQVCWCSQNLIDNPLLQVWVWNAVMISGLCITIGHRAVELLRQSPD